VLDYAFNFDCSGENSLIKFFDASRRDFISLETMEADFSKGRPILENLLNNPSALFIVSLVIFL